MKNVKDASNGYRGRTGNSGKQGMNEKNGRELVLL